MVKEIHIIRAEHTIEHILVDGPIKSNRGRRYVSLKELLDSIPGSVDGLKPNRPINIYIEGYDSEQNNEIKSDLSKKLKRPSYYSN